MTKVHAPRNDVAGLERMTHLHPETRRITVSGRTRDERLTWPDDAEPRGRAFRTQHTPESAPCPARCAAKPSLRFFTWNATPRNRNNGIPPRTTRRVSASLTDGNPTWWRRAEESGSHVRLFPERAIAPIITRLTRGRCRALRFPH